MASSPVAAATEFIIQLNANQPCTKEEGVRWCSLLIEWIRNPTHPDYYEAATMPFFLARNLLKRDLITKEECTSIRITTKSLQKEKPIEKDPSTHVEVCKQWRAFLKDAQATRQQGIDLFERLIHWISVCDQDEYDGSTITVFSMALELEKKKWITSQERDILLNRAFQVIVKDPKKKIKDQDLVEFLCQRGFKMKK